MFFVSVQLASVDCRRIRAARGRRRSGAQRETDDGKEKVQVSVARYLRTPPYPAKGKDFNRGCRAALSSETCLSIVVVGNYRFDPITAVSCRAKVRSLHPRRSYFAPIRNRLREACGLWWRRRVPPPGPKGLFHRPFIAIVRRADGTNIGRCDADWKTVGH